MNNKSICEKCNHTKELRSKKLCISCHTKELRKTEKGREYEKQIKKKHYEKKYGSGDIVFNKLIKRVKNGESITNACLSLGMDRWVLSYLLNENQKRELKMERLANKAIYNKHYALNGEQEE